LQAKKFADNLVEAAKMMKRPTQASLVIDEQKIDGQLYDDFIPDNDKTKMGAVRAAKPQDLTELQLDFIDERLKAMLPLYKARNWPELLTPDEKQIWQDFRRRRLLDGDSQSRAARYYSRIEQLMGSAGISNEQRFALKDLISYGDQAVPANLRQAAL
jgi:exodeoxyribonuclease-1